MEIHALFARLARATEEYHAAQDALQAQGATVIRETRKELGLTQRDLAEQLGVSFTYISKVENGHARIGQETLAKLVALFREKRESAVKNDAPKT